MPVPNPTSKTEPPLDPPYADAEYHEVKDEDLIRIALAELDELVHSLIYLDRRILPNTHFEGGYEALNNIKDALKEMLGENQSW